VEIKAVIFDWGGVLIDDPAPGLMQYCAKDLGVSRQQYITAHCKFEADFVKGLISEEMFWSRICSELNVPKPKVPSLWMEAFKAAYVPREDVFSMAASLQRDGYKTAVLSNTEIPAMQYFYQLQYNMFDVLVFSCAEGTKKPERGIYERTIKKLGVQPEQSVFIDDRADYIKGAEQARLNTILFKSIEQVKNELVRLNVKVL
jgi:epoxide hydrolase-like predicted phosphatase